MPLNSAELTNVLLCCKKRCAVMKYFGPISNEQLLGVAFGRHSSDEQRAQALILLHKRFVDEHMEEIRAVVAENKEYQS